MFLGSLVSDLRRLWLPSEDSIRVINNYADVVILRHYEEGAPKRAVLVSNIPIINAGDGTG